MSCKAAVRGYEAEISVCISLGIGGAGMIWGEGHHCRGMGPLSGALKQHDLALLCAQ